MPLLVDVQCPECGHGSRGEYRRLGSDVVCAGCGKTTVPSLPVGGAIPMTGWELTFADFASLVSEPAYRSEIEPLLSAWFGYRVRGTGLVTSQGEAVDLLSVHLQIQDDEQQQLALYQTAMSLWR